MRRNSKPAEVAESTEEETVTESKTDASSPDETNSDAPRAKRGRKASPLTAAIRRWEKAKQAEEKANKAYDKVAPLAEAREDAKRELQEAYDALQTALGEAKGEETVGVDAD